MSDEEKHKILDRLRTDPEARYHLLGKSFPDENLEGAYLQEVRMMGSSFRGSVLVRANLRAAEVMGADFSGCRLAVAKMPDIKAMGARFDDADLTGVDLTGASLMKCRMKKVTLTESNLTDANLGEADLEGSILQGCKLHNTKLHGAILRGVNLRNCQVMNTDFTDAELGGADLRGIDFDFATIDTLIRTASWPDATVDPDLRHMLSRIQERFLVFLDVSRREFPVGETRDQADSRINRILGLRRQVEQIKTGLDRIEADLDPRGRELLREQVKPAIEEIMDSTGTVQTVGKILRITYDIEPNEGEEPSAAIAFSLGRMLAYIRVGSSFIPVRNSSGDPLILWALETAAERMEALRVPISASEQAREWVTKMKKMEEGVILAERDAQELARLVRSWETASEMAIKSRMRMKKKRLQEDDLAKEMEFQSNVQEAFSAVKPGGNGSRSETKS